MKNLFTFVCCLFCLFSIQAQSGYLKIEGIEGESTDRAHRAWSDLVSFSQAIQRPKGAATGQSRRRSNATLEDIICVKELDKASPKLQEAICTGKVFPKAEIHLTKVTSGTRQTYLKYELKNVLITSYNVSGANREVPMEELAISFEEITMIYTTFDPRTGKKIGDVTHKWNVKTGR